MSDEVLKALNFKSVYNSLYLPDTKQYYLVRYRIEVASLKQRFVCAALLKNNKNTMEKRTREI